MLQPCLPHSTPARLWSAGAMLQPYALLLDLLLCWVTLQPLTTPNEFDATARTAAERPA